MGQYNIVQHYTIQVKEKQRIGQTDEKKREKSIVMKCTGKKITMENRRGGKTSQERMKRRDVEKKRENKTRKDKKRKKRTKVTDMLTTLTYSSIFK